MQILLLGGTGRTGQEFIDLALAGGHEVTAFVRSPWKVRRHEPSLRIVEGDPRDCLALGRALAGHEAVITALGPSPGSAVIRPDRHRLPEAAPASCGVSHHEERCSACGVSPELADASALTPGQGLLYPPRW